MKVTTVRIDEKTEEALKELVPKVQQIQPDRGSVSKGEVIRMAIARGVKALRKEVNRSIKRGDS